ncbi:MAG TPA: SBBP repeat-containing protein, partial [Terriglobia bacterium]|nr:SBBP repeat-containing protein [Terriglobia bacterium]
MLWLLVVSLAVLLGSAIGRWTPRKLHKAGPGAAEKKPARGAKNGDNTRHSSEGRLKASASIAGESIKSAFASYGKIPVSFEPNQGQAVEPIRYLSRSNNQSVYLKSDEVILALPIVEAISETAPKTPQRKHDSQSLEPWTQLQMKFSGANPNVEIHGEQELSRKSNYMIGADPRTWRANIPNYSRVRYSNLYAGVDLVFYGNPQLLEYDLVVKPGANLRQVSLSLNLVLGGSDSHLQIEPQTGDLVFQSSQGRIRQKRPRAYQEVDGKKKWVSCGYILDRAGQVGFDVGEYDHVNPLIIDPVLTYSVVGIGGNAIAVDADGNVYVAGVAGIGFRTTPGAFQSVPGGGSCASGPNTVPCADVLVAKLNPAGTDLVYSTFLGGNGADYSYGLAVDGSGNVYVAGTTSSTNFPTTTGAFQTGSLACVPFKGCYGAFVSKLNSTGTQLIYSTYLSGKSGGISANGIAVDSDGCAYVTGDSLNGGFITKLNANGSAAVYSTSGVGGAGVAVDLSGNAYVVGRQGEHSYVSKVSADGNTVMYNFRLGGSFPQFSVAPEELEGITGVAVDPQGYAYVTGYTAYSDFPTTPNAPFPVAQGVGNCGPSICRDAFISKLNSDGTGLVYSTYLGGSSVDYGTGIAVDLSGNAYVTGVTRSPDFPLIPGTVSGQKGGIFVSKMNAMGDAFLYSLTLGTGQTAESGNAVATDSKGNTYVTGIAGSDFPVAPGSYHPTVGSNGAFVAKVFDEITLFVPVVLSSAGQNGSFFSSELALTNRGGSDSELEYTYVAAMGGGSGEARDHLSAGKQLIITDTIAYLKGLGLSLGERENLGGTLRVRFLGLGSPAEGAAIVRTTTAVPGGRAGLAYPGVLHGLDEPSYLCGLRQNAHDRCNLAMQNAGTNLEGSITLQLEIFPSEPTITSGFSPVILEESLAPGEFKQISGILGQGSSPISNGFVRVSRIEGAAPYYAYAVIN